MCGFNKNMEIALNAFSKELVDFGLISRTNKNAESIDQGIKRELSDMTRMLAELHRIDDADKRFMTEGIIKYAIGFYMKMRKLNVEGKLASEYVSTVEKIGKYFEAMDAKFYGELEGKSEDMKELIEFLNQKEI